MIQGQQNITRCNWLIKSGTFQQNEFRAINRNLSVLDMPDNSTLFINSIPQKKKTAFFYMTELQKKIKINKDVTSHKVKVCRWVPRATRSKCKRHPWKLPFNPTEARAEALAGVPEAQRLIGRWWHWSEAARAVHSRGLESRGEWRGGGWRGGDG